MGNDGAPPLSLAGAPPWVSAQAWHARDTDLVATQAPGARKVSLPISGCMTVTLLVPKGTGPHRRGCADVDTALKPLPDSDTAEVLCQG